MGFFSAHLPRNHMDAFAMGFTFIMIPVSYFHGVLYIAPTIWPINEPNLPEETALQNTSSYYTSISVMTFLFINTYINLFLTMTVDTSCGRLHLPIVSQPGWYFCPFCQYYAPPRAHHCATCQKCILRRDHHCFFVGKCVGYYNHRYFIAFLMYLTASAIYGVVTSFLAINRLTGGLSLILLPTFIFPVFAWLFQIMPVNPFVMLETSLAMFVIFGAGALLVLQIYEAFKGQTYHELQKSINVYGGSPRENFKEVLGRNWWFCWVLPFIPSPRLGDGSHFPPRDKVRGGTREGVASGTWFGGDGKRKMVKST